MDLMMGRMSSEEGGKGMEDVQKKEFKAKVAAVVDVME